MSRGLGRWQRLLLDAVTNHPNIAPSGSRYIHAQSWLRAHLGQEPTQAEVQAVYRAARTLVARGLVYGAGGDRLEPLDGPRTKIPY